MSKRVVSPVKKKQKDESIAGALLQEVYAIVCKLYLISVFVVMPLYIYDHYYEMAFYKWKIYLFATLGLVGTVLFIGSLYGVVVICKNHQEKKTASDRRLDFQKIIRCVDATDVFAVLYAVSSIVALLSCGYPRAAWLGTDSWYMGTLAQLLFVGTFLIFSWLKAPFKDVVWMNILASGICFVIGIAQRYGNDFLHLYYGMPDEVIRDYLSTIGNRTWYSGYIAVIFPIGIYLFWRGESTKGNWLLGVYTFVTFSAIVTNNSDSIYGAAAMVLFALFVMSVGNIKKIYRWINILELWFLACCTMAVLRKLFSESTRLLRGLSQIFLDIRVCVVGLLVVGCMTIYLRYLVEKRGWEKKTSLKTRKRQQVGCIVVAFIMTGVLIGIIVANTTGLFQQAFGFTIDNSYLFFDDRWGDSRGFNWKITWRMFRELPLVQKLFGVGSDCYAFYAYSNQTYVEALNGFFGQGVTVANAHNEWLNSLLCNGIVGSFFYLGIFISVMIKCFKQSDSEHMNPIAPAIGLSVLGYITHNVFCYQQVCATGPIFILMGIAVQNIRVERREQR